MLKKGRNTFAYPSFFLNLCYKTCFFFLDNLQISQLSVSLQCVFHSIRFKVNKGWSTAVLLFLCPYVTYGAKSEFLHHQFAFTGSLLR